MHSAIPNLRIALYARVSSEQQGKASSITRQLTELRQRIGKLEEAVRQNGSFRA